MRRIILLLLTLFLASGTVAGSLAHATEDRAEASLFVAAIEAGCVSAPATESAESDKKNSSYGEKQQVPAAAHGCHGPHSGVPAETLSAATETPSAEAHEHILTAVLPHRTNTGTLRPTTPCPPNSPPSPSVAF